MGGGIAALQKKDVLQGALMGAAGGALGGAFAPAAGGIAGATEATASSLLPTAGAETTSALLANPQGMFTGAAGSGAGVTGITAPTATSLAGMGGGTGIVAPQTASLGFSGVAPVASSPFNIGNFLSQNKFALAGGALGGSMAPGEEPDKPDEGNVYDYGFDQQLNPRRNEPGQSYYTQRYNLKGVQSAEDYDPTKFAANGGIIALADGGNPQDYRVSEMIPAQTNTYAPNVRAVAPEVAAYNQQMMQRANQQYNINPRPAALQVPGFDRPATPTAPAGGTSAGTAPAAIGPTDYIDDYYQQMLGRNADPTGRKAIEAAIGKSWYDPARDIPEVIRQSAEFKQSGKNSNPTGIEIGKKYAVGAPATGGGIGGLGFDPKTGRYTGTFEAPGNKKTDVQKMREELDALKSEQSRYNDTGGGGAANGGLMMSYAMGGDIGTRYQSPDDASGMGDKVGAHQTVNMAPHYPMQGLYQGYAGGGHLGDYSDGGRLLKGPGDGVSDDIPAQIGARQPARLADGEFVVPARIVSELGNGSTDAGAKRLYAMMDRVQRNRTKSVGKGKVAVDSKAYRHLPA
jgi:hypothetical protein